MSVYPFIEAERAQQHSVQRACQLLEVSRAAYYSRQAGPSGRQRDDEVLTARIKAVHAESKGRYGAPRVHAELARRGHHHGRKRIARLMRGTGLRGKAAKRWKRTTIPDKSAAPRPDLIGRDFTARAAAVHTRWCGNITYIPTGDGWLYLATVIDIASRRIVGHAMADHLRTELPAAALANAVAARDPAAGVIFHADRGCQHTSAQFAELASHCQVLLSRGRTGQCWDNALAESFFSAIKGELLDDLGLAHSRRRPQRHYRIHRLVQRHPAAQHTRLQVTRRIRNHHHAREPEARSLTTISPVRQKPGRV